MGRTEGDMEGTGVGSDGEEVGDRSSSAVEVGVGSIMDTSEVALRLVSEILATEG